MRLFAFCAGAAVAVVLAWSSSACATPTRWAQARDARVLRDELTREAAEAELLANRKAMRNPLEDPILRIESHAPKALRILEEAKAAESRDYYVRLLLARAYHETRHWAEAALAFEGVLRDPATPSVFRDDALADEAIAYARLDRQDDEIEAYESAIALDPHPASRATMLANQAEAFMVKGDTSRAISGYRSSLEQLGQVEATYLAPTTLWSLGVALDRSGDLEAGLESIARARSYDPKDTRLQAPNWFFVPDYDADYYAALGEWLVARRAPDTDQRLGAYDRAIIAWKQYLGRAPEKDHYVPVAKVRLKLVEHELSEFANRSEEHSSDKSTKPGKGMPDSKGLKSKRKAQGAALPPPKTVKPRK